MELWTLANQARIKISLAVILWNNIVEKAVNVSESGHHPFINVFFLLLLYRECDFFFFFCFFVGQKRISLRKLRKKIKFQGILCLGTDR